MLDLKMLSLFFLLTALPLSALDKADLIKAAEEIALPDDPNASGEDKKFIQRAYQIAQNAITNGNHPFGALLVYQGAIIMEYENQVITTQDITRHAELGLISKATRNLTPEIIHQSTLYTSTEPCIMCCGSIYWAKVKRVVYGVKSSQFSKLLDNAFTAKDSRTLYLEINPETQIIGPVLEKEGLLIHANYWATPEE